MNQATFSFSREDAEDKFLPMYNERGILQDNPFEVLDVKGVGRLMALAVEWGRRSRPGLKVGICGEHGGHPASIIFWRRGCRLRGSPPRRRRSAALQSRTRRRRGPGSARTAAGQAFDQRGGQRRHFLALRPAVTYIAGERRIA
mgnify:CR=1 FL=1